MFEDRKKTTQVASEGGRIEGKAEDPTLQTLSEASDHRH